MSSVSFPNSSSNKDSLEDQYYTPSFDTSSFQMNPLSSHPPRTPRTSMHASSSINYNSSITYEEKQEQEREENIDVDDLEIDPEEDRVKLLEPTITKEQVWREMFLSSNGRDKAFKLLQYSIKLGLFFHFSLTSSRVLRRPTRPAWEQDIVKRLQSTASGLSLTRKTLLLFNWLQPLTQILAQQSVPFSSELSTEKAKKVQKPFLHTLLYAPPPVLLELVQAIADDVGTWAKLGLLGQRMGSRADRFSDWCWLLATLAGLVENGFERQVIVGLQSEIEGRLYAESMTGATAKSKAKSVKLDEKELARLKNEDYWLQVMRAKLVMDLIFVSYDLFNIKRGREFMKATTGLASAILSSSKLFHRHKTALLKAALISSS